MKYVLVGLGNPGSGYAYNRHNIGFMALDCIQDYYDFPPFKIKQNAEITESKVGYSDVILVKPMCFMNLSGRPLQSIINFQKIPLDRVFVFHDDLDILPGVIKLKKGGGHGGHNGLKSLDECIGKDYWRIRMGIGHPGHKDAVSGYVLSNFKKTDEDWLATVLGMLAKHTKKLLTTDPQKWHSQLCQDLKDNL